MSQAILVGLILAFGIFSDQGLGDPMIKRPIVMSALVGWALGDLTTGVMMGAALELVFLGVTSIGGTIPSDALTGSVLGTAFAIITGSGAEVALALAVPIGLLAVFIRSTFQLCMGFFMPIVDRFIENGEEKKIFIIHFGSVLGISFIHFIVGYLGIALGSSMVQAIVDSIPDSLMHALTVISGILPALGLAILLSQLWEKKTAVYLLGGFVLVAYLSMPTIAVALIGIIIAVTVGIRDMDVKNNAAAVAYDRREVSEEEDFFND